ncbi:glycosyltransferase family 2 protein [Acetobacter orientalis]|uniref:glycosyltransferase family 2 protein n=1 Tax=Acetobacter orientalis TaxID=146474 RepID=UPI0039E9462F
MEKIIAILVTYNPDIEKLNAAIASITHQVDQIVIIDNHSKSLSGVRINDQKKIIEKLNSNMGIAFAQNIGISRAIKHNADYVFFMDQDSVFDGYTVKALLQNHKRLSEKDNIKVGVVGVAYKDTNNKFVNHIWRDDGHKIEKILFTPQDSIVEVDFSISSGSLFATNVFDTVGLMDAGLFIDLVDIEWGLRAQNYGYKHFQVNQCIMQHTIGEKKINLFGRRISVHNPIRNYYLIRNSIILFRRKNLNRRWRMHFFKRTFLFFPIYSLFVEERKKRIHYMLKGFWDGFHNRTGHF